ncbi:MAG: hypothetical protein Q9222_006503 [Ikaeria aurantiellina]
MAAVAVSPAQYQLGIMSNRRAPLSSVPHAVNSPYRIPGVAVAKRSRQQVDQEDIGYDQQPPLKRPAIGNDRPIPRTPPQRQGLQQAEARVFGKRPGNVQPTAFERRLLEAREKKAIELQEKRQEQRVERPVRSTTETFEGIRQWQKHYRKVFPAFVFYFESVADEPRARHAKFIRAFGAREEKFFSREVTHIVTSRAVPGDGDGKSSIDASGPSPTSPNPQTTNQLRTINPVLLDRASGSQIPNQTSQPKSKFDFDSAIGRKVSANGIREPEAKKTVGTIDILQRAKDMGIKIWTVEKLERISKTMLDHRADEPSLRGVGGRGTALNAPLPTKVSQDSKLSHLLRKEQLNGPSDASNSTDGAVPFRGPHIYVRCMDEKTKPILVKEFPRVAKREDGEWPQFRGNSAGKCPFIVDQSTQRQEIERIPVRVQKPQAQDNTERRQTLRVRSAVPSAASTMKEAIVITAKKEPLAESRERGNVPVPPKMCAPEQENGQTKSTACEKAQSPMKAPSQIPAAARLRFFNGEPAASGMQPSNITSAIRSQMISSTAAQPGAKAGTSKEVHGLKRKVLEKNGGPNPRSTYVPPRGIDPLGAARAERHLPKIRQTRRQAQERLVHIDEESTQSEDDEDVWRAEEVQQRRHIILGQAPRRDPKPGYCENCRDKYDDFDAHILDRKHRKFALSQENWKDLDKLLGQLGRPIKEAFEDSHALGSRARKAGQGILTVRFEMPFPIWCTTCPKPTIIGQGVRFNAEKKKVGNYYSTPIFSFRMKHVACGGWIEIRTDPKNTAYVVVEGAKKRDTGDEKVLEGDMVIQSAEEREKMQSDAFAMLEGRVEEKRQTVTDKSRIEELWMEKEKDWDDPYAASRKLRKVFRAERKVREKDEERTEDLKDRMSLGMELLAESEEDRRRAGFIEFGAVDGDIAGAKAKSKPLFSDLSATERSPVIRGKVSKATKAAAEAQKRRANLQLELGNNTRAAIDPFLNVEKLSSTAVPLVRRKSPEKTDEQEIEAVGPESSVKSQSVALVDYDSD